MADRTAVEAVGKRLGLTRDEVMAGRRSASEKLLRLGQRWTDVNKQAKAMIDDAKVDADLKGIEGCPAWVTWYKLTEKAFPKQHAVLLQGLRDRIEGQRQMLLGGQG